MDYIGKLAAAATIFGVILHQVGKYSERRRDRRRWRVGADWTHWARSRQGKIQLREILRNLYQDSN